MLPPYFTLLLRNSLWRDAWGQSCLLVLWGKTLLESNERKTAVNPFSSGAASTLETFKKKAVKRSEHAIHYMYTYLYIVYISIFIKMHTYISGWGIKFHQPSFLRWCGHPLHNDSPFFSGISRWPVMPLNFNHHSLARRPESEDQSKNGRKNRKLILAHAYINREGVVWCYVHMYCNHICYLTPAAQHGPGWSRTTRIMLPKLQALRKQRHTQGATAPLHLVSLLWQSFDSVLPTRKIFTTSLPKKLPAGACR